jgi:hypothetical protein
MRKVTVVILLILLSMLLVFSSGCEFIKPLLRQFLSQPTTDQTTEPPTTTPTSSAPFTVPTTTAAPTPAEETTAAPTTAKEPTVPPAKVLKGKFQGVEWGDYLHLNVRGNDGKEHSFFVLTNPGLDPESLEVGQKIKVTWQNVNEYLDPPGEKVNIDKVIKLELLPNFAYITGWSETMDPYGKDFAFDFVDWLSGKEALEKYMIDTGCSQEEAEEETGEMGYIRNTDTRKHWYRTNKKTKFYLPDEKMSVEPIEVDYHTFLNTMIPAIEDGDSSLTFVEVTVSGDYITEIRWTFHP